MKTNHDNPTDDLGQLGQVIRPTKPAEPDPVREFELLGDQNAALESIAETLRRKASPVPVITEGDVGDWEGICMDEYTLAILGCI